MAKQYKVSSLISFQHKFAIKPIEKFNTLAATFSRDHPEKKIAPK